MSWWLFDDSGDDDGEPDSGNAKIEFSVATVATEERERETALPTVSHALSEMKRRKEKKERKRRKEGLTNK